MEHVTAEIYDKKSFVNIWLAEELLDKIQTDSTIHREGVVVDVGCGSGNVTRILAEAIPYSRLIGLDISEDMVDFARELSCSDPRLEFLTQDISAPWERLHNSLKNLENQVELIWSNLTLHWVHWTKRGLAAENLVRLLRPGGKMYHTIWLARDFNENLDDKERKANEKVFRIPSELEQVIHWRNAFKRAGMSQIHIEILNKECELPFEDHAAFVGLHTSFLPLDLSEREQNKILEQFVNLFVRDAFTPYGKKPQNKIDMCGTKLRFKVLHVVGTK